MYAFYLRSDMQKAAKEMKERISKLGGNGVESKLITGMETA